MKTSNNINLNIKKPDNLISESDMVYQCVLCKDSDYREFQKIEETIKTNGDVLIKTNLNRVDGKLIETLTYLQRCDCYIERNNKLRFERRINESGLSELLKKNTFKNYISTEKWQEDMKSMCINFVGNPKGLLALLGNTGAGKTHLGSATAGNLAYKGLDVQYLEWRNEMSIAKSNYYQIEEETLMKWLRVDVLYIDDLFKVRSNNVKDIQTLEFEIAWEIINKRLESNKITIISSEFTLNELYSVDPSLAGRITEYAKNNMFNIAKDEKKNYRMKGII